MKIVKLLEVANFEFPRFQSQILIIVKTKVVKIHDVTFEKYE